MLRAVPAIEARDVAVRFEGRDVLEGVSMRVDSGQLCAVMGPNGAGKSSLLRLLSGEWKPCAGEVRVGGRPLESWSMSERARMRAVLVQDRVTGLPVTVGELLAMARRCHGPQKEALLDHQIGLLALRTVGAVDLADRLVTRLSGAEERRAQIARALAQVWPTKPGGLRLLLMDELLANLDPPSQHVVLRALRRFVEWGAAVVAVLYDVDVARKYADQVVLVREGRVAAAGRPAEILRSPVFEELARA